MQTIPSNKAKVIMFVLFVFKPYNRGKRRTLLESGQCVLAVVIERVFPIGKSRGVLVEGNRYGD